MLFVGTLFVQTYSMTRCTTRVVLVHFVRNITQGTKCFGSVPRLNKEEEMAAPVADLCNLVERRVRADGEVRAWHVIGDGGGQHNLST